MLLSNSYKTKLNRLCNFAIGIALLDGGTIFALQIIDFLISYFFTHIPQMSGDLQSLAQAGKSNMLITLINILNLSVIIYRVSGLSYGLKYPLITCYRKALSRMPSLILLYLGLGLTVASILLQLHKFLPGMFAPFIAANAKIFMLALLALIPVGLLACIFVIDQDKNPIQAIISTYKYIRYQSDLLILATLAIMYSLPLAFGSLFVTPTNAPYFALATNLWLLFCHLVTIVMYIDSVGKQRIQEINDKKPTKVVII